MKRVFRVLRGFSDDKKWDCEIKKLDLASLSGFYKRVSKGADFLTVREVQKKVVDEVELRFGFGNILEVSKFLYDYSETEHVCGMYTGTEIYQKIFKFFNADDPSLNNREVVKIYYRLLYFCYLSNLLNEDLVIRCLDKLKNKLHLLNSKELVKFGQIFSKFSLQNSRFWTTFSVKIDQIDSLKSTDLLNDLVILFFFLKQTEPRLQSKLYKSLSLDLQNLLLTHKPEPALGVKKYTLPQQSFLMTQLGQKKVFSQANFNEFFNIDLVLPYKRIGFEFYSPSEFLHPSNTLNGKHQEKLYFLSKRNWEIHKISKETTEPEISEILVKAKII